MYIARMATFIDDQGSTGWAPGAHTHYRLAAAWLPTANVRPFQEGVRALRGELGVRKDFEFKFAKTHDRPHWRTSFYRLAMDLGLKFRACAFDKNRIRPGSVAAVLFHQGCALSLAVHLRATYRKAEGARCAELGKTVLLREPVVVDNNDDPALLAAIDGAFRALRSERDPASPLTGKAEFRVSKKDEALQLADMVMGAVGAHLDGDSAWYDFLCGGAENLGVINLAECGAFPASCDLSESRVLSYLG